MTVQDTRIEAAREKEMHSFWNTVFRLKLARPAVSAGIYAEVPRDLLQGAVLLRTRPWLRGRLLHQGDFFTPVLALLSNSPPKSSNDVQIFLVEVSSVVQCLVQKHAM